MQKFIPILILMLAACTPYPSTSPVTSMDQLSYPYAVKKQMVLNDIEVAYVDEGQGTETLIFIHGLGSYLPAWKRNIEGLKQQYRCIALDLPGYGKSDKADYPYDMEFFANVVANFMQKLSINEATIVGHSMGGQIAMTMALYHSEKVKNLVLVSPAGFETFHEGQKQWFRDVFTARLVKLTPADAIQSNLAYNFYDMPEEAEFMITDRLAMRTASDFDWYCHAIEYSVKGMVDQPVFEFLPDIKQPTLVIFGENDNLIPNRFLNPGFTREVAEKGNAQLPNSDLVMIPNCGHFAQFEKPAEINESISKFLKQ